MDDNEQMYQRVRSALMSSYIDKLSTKNESYAKNLESPHANFVDRNERLTALFQNYISQIRDRAQTNKKLKGVIFWFFIVLLSILTISVIGFIVCTAISKNKDFSVPLITVSITYAGSLIAIFEIISKYLFPIDEEKDAVSMIKTVLNNDFKVEKLISKEVGHNQNEMLGNFRTIKQLYDDKILTEEEFNEAKKGLLEKLKK